MRNIKEVRKVLGTHRTVEALVGYMYSESEGLTFRDFVLLGAQAALLRARQDGADVEVLAGCTRLVTSALQLFGVEETN